MFCSSCGHDNPRENRYCGMCGTPFPHRFLTVPKEQSALTFPSAPIEIIPSQLPIPPEPIPPAAPLAATLAADILPDALFSVEPEALAEIEGATTPSPEVILVPEPAELHPVATSAGSPLEAPPTAARPAEPAAPPPFVVAEPAPPPPSPTFHDEAAQPTSSLPEIRRFATPHSDVPPAHVDTDTHAPSNIPRPPAPQSLEPPPDSAGMPTFQAIAEASGAPPITPFELPVEKNADEERELQEFIASFHYHPPEEAVDELTMRSEVPVLDAEAPITPSHPSFDDDVPPPPEAGPHPTGEEYYPPTHGSAERSRYLEIADTHHAATGHHASTSATSSFLGLNDAQADVPPSLDEINRPKRSHPLLWTSLAALLAIFGVFGFFEGRAQMNHAYPGPAEIIQEQYAKLRQRVVKMTASEPATNADKSAVEEPPPAKPQSKSPAADQPASNTEKTGPETPAQANPSATPSTQATPTPEQQQPKSAEPAPQQSKPAPNNQATATTAAPAATVAPQKSAAEAAPQPSTDATVAKREPPPAAAKPKSRNEPGQEELAKAMAASDPAAAAAWLWKATSRGNPVAPVRLADMYIKGKGVPHSCEQALVLLRAQAAKEDAAARNRLAALYASGTCVARDRVKAYQLMSSALAVDPGSEWAAQNRKELWQQMTPEERVLAQKYR